MERFCGIKDFSVPEQDINKNWTVHDGSFFASNVKERKFRAPNERKYQRVALQKNGVGGVTIMRFGSMFHPQAGSRTLAFAPTIEDGPAQAVSRELLASVACAFEGIGVSHTLPTIAGMFSCLSLRDPAVAVYMLVLGQQLFLSRGSEYDVDVLLAIALSMGIKMVIEERFFVGDIMQACDFLRHLNAEEMAATEFELFSSVSMDSVRERFVVFRAACASFAMEAVECRSSHFEIDLRVFFRPGIRHAFQETAMHVFKLVARSVRLVDRVSDAHILISDSMCYKEFALNPTWQFLRAPALVVLVEQHVTSIPGCVCFANLPSANALVVCVAHCM
jgi:hypothetical protein